MIQLPWSGIPLGHRLKIAAPNSFNGTQAALKKWRKRAGLDDDRAWQSRLHAAGVDERIFSAAIESGPAEQPDLTSAGHESLAEILSDLERLERIARKQWASDQFLRGVIGDLLVEFAPGDCDFSRHDSDSVDSFKILLEAVRLELLKRFRELIDREYDAMRAAGILIHEIPPGNTESRFLAILQVPGCVVYLVEEYPTLPFHLHAFIRYCVNQAKPFFSRNGELPRVAFVQRALARGCESLDRAVFGPRFEAIGGDNALVLVSEKGIRWRRVDAEAANIRWFLAMVKWLADRDIDIGVGQYEFLEDEDGGWLRVDDDSRVVRPMIHDAALFEFGALAAVLYLAGSHHMSREAVSLRRGRPVLNRMDTLFSNGPLRDGRIDPTHSVLSSMLLPRWRSDRSGQSVAGNLGLLARLLPTGLCDESDHGEEASAARGTAERDIAAGTREHHGLEAIVEGFEKCYREMLLGREDLLASRWFCGEGSGITGRVILQDGRRYGILGGKVHSPAWMTHALHADTDLELLWRNLGPKFPAAVLNYEIEALWRGVCPQYWSSNNGTALYDEEGALLVPEYFKFGITCRIKERLKFLCPADARRQACHIVQSCALFHDLPSFSPRDWTAFWRDRNILTSKSANPAARAGDAANQIRDVLAASAPIRTGEDWLGVSRDADENWQLGGIPHGMGSGLDGIGLFFMHFHHATGDPECGSIAATILRSAAKRLARAIDLSRSSALDFYSPDIPPYSCATLLAHAVRCGRTNRNASALLAQFWCWIQDDVRLPRNAIPAPRLAARLRFLAEIFECAPLESGRIALRREAGVLEQLVRRSASEGTWAPWLPSSYVALVRTGATSQDKKLLETASRIEALMLDRLEALRFGDEHKQENPVTEQNVAEARHLLLHLLDRAAVPGRDRQDRIDQGVDEYLSRCRTDLQAASSTEILNHFYLLDAAARKESRAPVLSILQAKLEEVLCELNSNPWRSGGRGAPYPFLGLADGLTAIGLASLHQTFTSFVPGPWFLPK